MNPSLAQSGLLGLTTSVGPELNPKTLRALEQHLGSVRLTRSRLAAFK